MAKRGELLWDRYLKEKLKCKLTSFDRVEDTEGVT